MQCMHFTETSLLLQAEQHRRPAAAAKRTFPNMTTAADRYLIMARRIFLAYLPEVRRDDAGIGALGGLGPVDLREGPDRVEHDHAGPAVLEHHPELHVAVGGQRRE